MNLAISLGRSPIGSRVVAHLDSGHDVLEPRERNNTARAGALSGALRPVRSIHDRAVSGGVVSALASRPPAVDEFGLDFVARQVPADRAERDGMERATGGRSIPTLVFAEGNVVSGDDDIIAALDRRFSEPPGAAAHREKAVEEWPERLRLAG